MMQSPPAAFSPLHIFAAFSADSKGPRDKSPIIDPRGAEIGATNDRLVAVKLVGVFRLQRPKSGLSPAFTALRRNLNRIATGDDGSGHCRSAVRIGVCDRNGGQMLVVRRAAVTSAPSDWPGRGGDGKTRRRRIQPPLSAAPLGSVQPDRRGASQARSPGAAEGAERLLGAQSWAGCSSREAMLSIEPVVAGPIGVCRYGRDPHVSVR